jgi:hypothetical protein
VAICSAASFRREVEGFGLTHIDAGLDWLKSSAPESNGSLRWRHVTRCPQARFRRCRAA